jgi:hypothetical protein
LLTNPRLARLKREHDECKAALMAARAYASP